MIFEVFFNYMSMATINRGNITILAGQRSLKNPANTFALCAF